MFLLQVASDDEALEEEGNTGGEGNGGHEGNAAGEGNGGHEGNGADGDGDQNEDDDSEVNLRDVFDDPNDDGVVEAIAEAEADAQREHEQMEAQAVEDQYMAEAMNIPSSELSVGSLIESAKELRRDGHVS